MFIYPFLLTPRPQTTTPASHIYICLVLTTYTTTIHNNHTVWPIPGTPCCPTASHRPSTRFGGTRPRRWSAGGWRSVYMYICIYLNMYVRMPVAVCGCERGCVGLGLYVSTDTYTYTPDTKKTTTNRTPLRCTSRAGTGIWWRSGASYGNIFIYIYISVCVCLWVGGERTATHARPFPSLPPNTKINMISCTHSHTYIGLPPKKHIKLKKYLQ
jgi:hypothetical protein